MDRMTHVSGKQLQSRIRQTVRFGALALAVAAALVAPSLTGGSAALAAEGQPDPTAHIRSFFTQWGVPAKTVERLISDFKAGKRWDSTTDAIPASERTVVKGELLSNIGTFADGSIVVTTFGTATRAASGGVTPMGQYLSCARSSGGSGYVSYNECTVSGSNALLEITFFADYTRFAGGATIDNVYSPYAYATGGSADTPTLNITRAYQSGSLPAEAHAQTQYVAANHSQSFTAHLYLRVNMNTASVVMAGY